jgi:fumarate reductase flavoprotein subunit
MSRDYDVIVVGGGGAGLSAANVAAKSGSKVLLLDSAERLGGSTSMSQGIVYAAGTSVQAKAGIRDTPDAMFLYALAINQYRTEPSVLRRYCDEGADALDWLISLGVEFPADQVSSTGTYSEMSGVPRCHAPVGFGAAITVALDAALPRHLVDVSLRTRLRELKFKDGVVQGIEVDGAEVRAGAVVLSTGGFGANREMLRRYYPRAARHNNDTWYIGSQHCRGDGILLGTQVGADVAGFDTGLTNVTPCIDKILDLPPSWLIIVNQYGRRFMNEVVGYGVMSGIVDAQPGGECYGIFDQDVFENPPRDPRFAKFIAAGVMDTQWTADRLRTALATGRIIKADNLDELADKLGIRGGALRNSVEAYNTDSSFGVDRLFFKDGSMMRPIASPPFYGATLRSAILCLTSAGLRIDRDARVLDVSNRPIPGLFAAGETASSGVMGECYIGSGSSVANAVIFGRIAGRNAATAAANG